MEIKSVRTVKTYEYFITTYIKPSRLKSNELFKNSIEIKNNSLLSGMVLSGTHALPQIL